MAGISSARRNRLGGHRISRFHHPHALQAQRLTIVGPAFLRTLDACRGMQQHETAGLARVPLRGELAVADELAHVVDLRPVIASGAFVLRIAHPDFVFLMPEEVGILAELLC